MYGELRGSRAEGLGGEESTRGNTGRGCRTIAGNTGT